MRVLGKSPWILIWLSVLMTGSAFVPPLALLGAGVLGIWMVIGRENFWLRIVLAFVYFLPSLQHRFEVPLLQCFVLLVSMLFSYLTNIILQWLGKVSMRSTQFGLWQIGGWMLALSLLFTAFRFTDFAPESMSNIDVIEMCFILLAAACVSLNIVCSCCPFFVPKSKRTTSLWICAFASPLLILPVLEMLFCGVIFTIDRYIRPEEIVMAFVSILILHPLGLIYVWFVAMPMDTDGYFRSDDPKKELT